MICTFLSPQYGCIKAIIRFFLFCCFICTFHVPINSAETRVETHFENTDHEMTVYYINGKEPSATMMIIGGIQGDEPGGYLAADLYADMVLEKGNLIIVPRANFYSIKKNQRGVNGDMNRKFAINTSSYNDYDSKIVDILKRLMAKSDVLLNLHEGSGYYYPEYVSNIKNPMKYGQSIIIDTPVYICEDGKHIDLEQPALRVIEEMNHTIKDPDHCFHLNNHDTFSENTKHAEQRRSATYNALSLFHIPAYGIESSKNITSITTKVKYQTLAINAFMRQYGIVPEHPSIYLPTPKLDHLVITIEGNSVPFAVKNGSTLSVPMGSSIKVTSVVANYIRGIYVDILNQGNTNDLNRITFIDSPSVIKVYKDAYVCGEILLAIAPEQNGTALTDITVSPPAVLKQVEVLINNKNYVIPAGETFHIIEGDIIRLIDAWTTNRANENFRLNFYGFIGNKKENDAEDRGYDIDTAVDLIKRFSIDGHGKMYRIEALQGAMTIGEVFIALDEPKIQYLIIENQEGNKQALSPGAIVMCQKSATFHLVSIISNVISEPAITPFISKNRGEFQRLYLPASFKIPINSTLMFKRNKIDLGSITFEVKG